MNENELAFRCVELALKYGTKGDPYEHAQTYFQACKSLTADKSKDPATGGKTPRRKPTKNS